MPTRQASTHKRPGGTPAWQRINYQGFVASSDILSPSLWMRGQVKRRAFITLFFAAMARLVEAAAQTKPWIPRVGYIGAGAGAANNDNFEAFLQGLRELGYVEGQTIELDARWSAGRVELMPALVTELIGRKVDILVITSNTGALAAKKATRSIPIVMFAGDPVGIGLVETLARPGGNVTGLSYSNEEISGRRLQLLKELVPELTRVGVLRNPLGSMHHIFWRETEVAARKLAVTLQPLDVSGPEDFEAAFATAKLGNVQGLLVFDNPLSAVYKRRFVALAASNRLPVIYGVRGFVDDGGLMSYGANYAALFRRAATFVDRILKGAKPADLPVEQPTKFEFIINVKVANALGLTVPPTLLTQADETIE